MINLPKITLVCIDCRNYNPAIGAINESIKSINFGKVLFLTDKDVNSESFETVIIDKISSKEQYSQFVINELLNYIMTDYCLIIQYDGYVINPELWDDSWLNYDYIGAPWWYDESNVGNGGFSLRSKKLLNSIKMIDSDLSHPEDEVICRRLRPKLESDYNIKFAPNEVAAKFSFEPNHKAGKFQNNTFGFHGLPQLIKNN